MVPYLCGHRNKTLRLEDIARYLQLPSDKLHIPLNIDRFKRFRIYITDYFKEMENDPLAVIDSGREPRYSKCIFFLIDELIKLHNNSCEVNLNLIMRNEPRVCSVNRNRMLDLAIVEEYSSGGKEREVYLSLIHI